jgi:hypothetical protein
MSRYGCKRCVISVAFRFNLLSAHMSVSFCNSNKANFEQRLETNGTRNGVSDPATAIVLGIVIGLRYTKKDEILPMTMIQRGSSSCVSRK